MTKLNKNSKFMRVVSVVVAVALVASLSTLISSAKPFFASAEEGTDGSAVQELAAPVEDAAASSEEATADKGEDAAVAADISEEVVSKKAADESEDSDFADADASDQEDSFLAEQNPKQTFTVTATCDPAEGGTLSPASVGDIPNGSYIEELPADHSLYITKRDGTTQDITLTISEGYSFVEWEGLPDEKEITKDLNLTCKLNNSATCKVNGYICQQSF